MRKKESTDKVRMNQDQELEIISESKSNKEMSLLKGEKGKETNDAEERNIVRKMRRYIQKLTSSKYGYTYNEVSEMLESLGINLSSSRIEYLVGEVKKSKDYNEEREVRKENNILENPSDQNKIEPKEKIKVSDNQGVKSGKIKTKKQ
jgi:hypothetical protein